MFQNIRKKIWINWALEKQEINLFAANNDKMKLYTIIGDGLKSWKKHCDLVQNVQAIQKLLERSWSSEFDTQNQAEITANDFKNKQCQHGLKSKELTFAAITNEIYQVKLSICFEENFVLTFTDTNF